MTQHTAVVLEVMEGEPLEPKVFVSPEAHVFALEHFQRICEEQKLEENQFYWNHPADRMAGDNYYSVHLWYIG